MILDTREFCYLETMEILSLFRKQGRLRESTTQVQNLKRCFKARMKKTISFIKENNNSKDILKLGRVQNRFTRMLP